MTDMSTKKLREISFNGNVGAGADWFCAMWAAHPDLCGRRGYAEAKDPAGQADMTLIPGMSGMTLKLVLAGFAPRVLAVAGKEAILTFMTEDACGVLQGDWSDDLGQMTAEGASLPVLRMNQKSGDDFSISELMQYIQNVDAFADARLQAWYAGKRSMQTYCGNDGKILYLAAESADGQTVLFYNAAEQHLLIAAAEEIPLPKCR